MWFAPSHVSGAIKWRDKGSKGSIVSDISGTYFALGCDVEGVGLMLVDILSDHSFFGKVRGEERLSCWEGWIRSRFLLARRVS